MTSTALTDQQAELGRLRRAVNQVLFRSTFMGGIQSTNSVRYDFEKGDIEALRVYDRLLTVHCDPKPLVATVRVLQDHGGRHLLPVLTNVHVAAYLSIQEALNTNALHSGKRQSDSDLNNGREVCLLVLEDLSREPAVRSIILDRGIVDAHQVKLVLDDIADTPTPLLDGAL